ncbi:MAG: endonuclease/exonuclease/phosphatase family protein, partial [Muricauda sp.]|nr:endonuclease/exonuclease/phosphatase family protein [Allomuricauda sp.]
MRIISWNVNGIRAVVKKDFFENIAKMGADILCLQETKAQDHEVENELSALTDFESYYNSAEKTG